MGLVEVKRGEFPQGNVLELAFWWLEWILPSQPTGYILVGKPSTGCGTLRQSHIANAGITGRKAHQNYGSNANATMIYC